MSLPSAVEDALYIARTPELTTNSIRFKWKAGSLVVENTVPPHVGHLHTHARRCRIRNVHGLEYDLAVRDGASHRDRNGTSFPPRAASKPHSLS